MWVFGFGSLMWDGWQRELGCLSTHKAELLGYRRRFNKASVRNWGTEQMPGPTLNVEESTGCSCEGIAFEFPSETASDGIEYLKKREGKSFELVNCSVILEGGERVSATVPIYSGKNVLEQSPEELAELAVAASGTSGRCADYVLTIAKELERLGISDPEVEAFAALVERRLNGQQGHQADARSSHR